MQAIVEAAIPNARIAAVLVPRRCRRAGLAAARGVATQSLEHKTFGSRLEFDQANDQKNRCDQPDLVVLAGFMRILTPNSARIIPAADQYPPSLLPAFTGLHTHERALEAGCRIAGCTIHLITP